MGGVLLTYRGPALEYNDWQLTFYRTLKVVNLSGCQKYVLSVMIP